MNEGSSSVLALRVLGLLHPNASVIFASTFTLCNEAGAKRHAAAAAALGNLTSAGAKGVGFGMRASWALGRYVSELRRNALRRGTASAKESTKESAKDSSK